MSGGVDSAVAAARAIDAGHEVTGVHLALSPSPESHRNGARGCCSLEDSRDARRAADVLDIPFYVWDVAERFNRDVVEDFVARVRRWSHPEPLRPVQREDQVRRGARPCARARLRRRLHRPLRPDRRRPAAPRGRPRKDQSYVLACAAPGPDRGGDVPARRLAEDRGTGRGGRARARRRDEARQPRHLLHPVRRHRRLVAPAAGFGARRHRRRVAARSSGPTTVPTDSRSASAGVWRCRPPPRTAGRVTCCRCRRCRAPSRSAGRATGGLADRVRATDLVRRGSATAARLGARPGPRARRRRSTCRVAVVDGWLVADVEPGLEAVRAGSDPGRLRR